jgi:uncharacterized protein YjbI with pentapeptide repeats
VPLAEASVCLAHMASRDNDLFEAELRRINEHGVIDARGLWLTADLLDRIVAAARNSRGHTILRDARFDRATFDCVARFNELTFEGEANFGAAVFKYGVQFYGTNFKSIVRFQDATFDFEALFEEAVFNDALLFHGVEFQRASFRRTTFKRLAGFFWARFKSLVTFDEATFKGAARFEGSKFGDDAWFKKTAFQDEAEFLGSTFGSGAHFKETTFWGSAGFSTCIFEGDADFTGTTFRGRVSLTPKFHGDARFDKVVFVQGGRIGPLLASQQFSLRDTVFERWVQLEIAAPALQMGRAQFLGGAQIRVRWASIRLEDASVSAPSILKGVPAFTGWDEGMFKPEWQPMATDPQPESWRPRLLSLARSDVAGLRISNVTCKPAASSVPTISTNLVLPYGSSWVVRGWLVGADPARRWGR